MTDKITKNAAKKLAVAYSTYNQATNRWSEENTAETANSVVVWARFLIDAQEETGIEIHDKGLLTEMLKQAEKDLGALEQSAA